MKRYWDKSRVFRSVKCEAKGEIGAGGVLWEAEKHVDGTWYLVNGFSLECSWRRRRL